MTVQAQLDAFAAELVNIYGMQIEMEAGLNQWRSQIGKIVSKQGVSWDNRMVFATGSPTDPNSKMQYARRLSEIFTLAGQEGAYAVHFRRMAVAHVYARWEHSARALIAGEIGIADNDLKSPVFGDLRHYRQAILHVNGRLDKKTEVLPYFRKGDFVNFTKDIFHDLFVRLIDALNQIARDHYGISTGYSLDKTLAEAAAIMGWPAEAAPKE